MNYIKDLAGDGSLYGDPSAVLAIKSGGSSYCTVLLSTNGEPVAYNIYRSAVDVAENIDRILTELYSEGVNDGDE